MALPIRLFAGARGDIEIPLQAQSIDIAIDRNASHFPLPNMPRIAIDTNTPEIGIEIQGILQDDDVNFESESSATLVQGNSIMLNFASILPTSTEILNEVVWTGGNTGANNPGGMMFPYSHILHPIIIRSSVNSFVGVTGTSTTIDIHDIDDTYSGSAYDSIEATDNEANANTGVDIAHPSSGTYAVGTTSIVVDSSSHSIRVNQRIHKDGGAFIGTVTAVSSATLTIAGGTKVSLGHNTDVYSYQATLFNRRHQVIGSVTDLVIKRTYNDDGDETSRKLTHITVDRVEVPVSDKEAYLISDTYAPPNETFLHHKEISIYPNFWRKSATKDAPTHTPAKVVIRFTNLDEAHHTYTTESSGGTAISITQQGRYGYVPNINVVVTVPVKGITTKPSNGNPAATLALMVKDAITLGTQAVVATHDHITSTGGITLASAFSATVSGPLIEINQLDPPKKTEWGNNLPPCLQLNENNSINDLLVHVAANQSMALVCEHFGVDAVESMAITNKSKSAGDKVQDLLGLFSNAQKQRDLIRGIQVPYDSLIQSSGVTGVARNFFLTFGEQSIDDKGSLGGTVSASQKMTPSLLPYEMGGDPVDETDDSWAERFGLGQLTDVDASLGNFLENIVADTLITLSSKSHGNEGGIRIIPEKLHVRYDAGNNYYAFNMKLLASDFVMGV